MSLRQLALAASALCVLAAANDAGAYVREAANWNPGTLPITYHVNTSTVPAEISSTGVNSVDAAFASWAGPTCTRWRATNGGSTTATANESDGVNVIQWISGSWPSELGDVTVTIGVTTPVWFSGGYFTDADIRFNNVGFTWNTTGRGGTGSRTAVDTQSIATHEEGHFLGLGHTPDSTAIMYASYSGGIKRTLAADDISGVCTIYPSGGPVPDAGTAPDSGTSTGGGDVGTACASDPSVCAAGDECVCRDMAMTDCFCTHTCSTSSPCPTGSTCQNTGIGELCIPGGSTGGGTGMGATGATCMGGQDCSSGICVSTSTGATSGICSQICANDCSCPAGFTCVPTTMTGTSVCAPGTSTCGSTGSDGGGVMAHDAATTGGNDAGGTTSDAGGTMNDAAVAADSGHTSTSGGDVGCGCAVPGGGASGHRGAWALVALGAAVATLGARRRRRA